MENYVDVNMNITAEYKFRKYISKIERLILAHNQYKATQHLAELDMKKQKIHDCEFDHNDPNESCDCPEIEARDSYVQSHLLRQEIEAEIQQFNGLFIRYNYVSDYCEIAKLKVLNDGALVFDKGFVTI